MTDSKKQEFTLRITRANNSQLIVILCDMFIVYCDDASLANDKETFKMAIRRARAVLSELIRVLDRKTDLSNCIYELYRFVERQLIKSDVKNDKSYVAIGKNIIEKLNVSYKEASKQDNSEIIMQNTQELYAGMTYGKYDLAESSDISANRGFFA